MTDIFEKIEKKVYVRAGFTESQRTKNLEKASKVWKSKGWFVVKMIDGGLTKSSYLELEKQVSHENPESIDQKKPVGILLGIGILLLPVIFSWFTLRKSYTTLARVVSFTWLVFRIIIFTFSDDPEVSQKTEIVSNEVKQEASSKKIKEKIEFQFTVQEFLQRYNQAFLALDRNIKASIKKENDNGKYLTIQALTNNKNVGLVIGANSKTRKVQSITFIGIGDGTMQSGLDILFGTSAVVMAIENPNMPVDQRGEIVSDLGFSNGRLSKLGKLSVERTGIKYSISLSDTIGTWLVAEPIQ
ncbi:hypothetical protein [Bathymodiolus thermophilus thioautotrophic gill symbiont]|uniref:Uncharacterized protein n=1 Tax=Bathymodiolus thermophilus thioautotrophic gill symbiont TaxID=2360 RepID=A0A1J5UHH0_9GAMM|nr:hypothetical protein [Bathymodiolus thermophilus thioautotrophic gill symbiont]OIR25341.1 hypothetical protein BGC33_06245 [Bathymodiolus thermophilus thioautotrophic gill symbiont]